MKPTLLIIILPVLALAAPVATLCPVDLTNETAALFGTAPNYAKGPSGTIYKTAWSDTEFPNSGTHTNITVQGLETIAASLPTLGKSVSISGIDDPLATFAALGMVRCDAAGNDLTEEPTE